MSEKTIASGHSGDQTKDRFPYRDTTPRGYKTNARKVRRQKNHYQENLCLKRELNEVYALLDVAYEKLETCSKQLEMGRYSIEEIGRP